VIEAPAIPTLEELTERSLKAWLKVEMFGDCLRDFTLRDVISIGDAGADGHEAGNHWKTGKRGLAPAHDAEKPAHGLRPIVHIQRHAFDRAQLVTEQLRIPMRVGGATDVAQEREVEHIALVVFAQAEGCGEVDAEQGAAHHPLQWLAGAEVNGEGERGEAQF